MTDTPGYDDIPGTALTWHRDGRGAALRGADGRLVVLGDPGDFVLGQWLEADGETAISSLNEVAPNCYLDAVRWDEALRESLGGP